MVYTIFTIQAISVQRYIRSFTTAFFLDEMQFYKYQNVFSKDQFYMNNKFAGEYINKWVPDRKKLNPINVFAKLEIEDVRWKLSIYSRY